MVEVCPVCHGRGVVQHGFYSTNTGYWSSTTTGTETCRSCMGKGYIQITKNVDKDIASIEELKEMQQRLKRLEELANLASVQSSHSTLKLGRCCATCKYTDDMMYMSNPPKFKCNLHQNWDEWSNKYTKCCPYYEEIGR